MVSRVSSGTSGDSVVEGRARRALRVGEGQGCKTFIEPPQLWPRLPPHTHVLL